MGRCHIYILGLSARFAGAMAYFLILPDGVWDVTNERNLPCSVQSCHDLAKKATPQTRLSVQLPDALLRRARLVLVPVALLVAVVAYTYIYIYIYMSIYIYVYMLPSHLLSSKEN